MAAFQDQDYLLQEQYKDDSNFSARVELHRRFSTNRYGFHHWVFDHFQIPEGGRVLELGCGPGGLWRANLWRIPESWQIILTDFSPGMLESARKTLGKQRFNYQVADAQSLPFPDASFDAVIANHMLYHIPDLPKALQEIQRILKPQGYLYATTIGRQHMYELTDLLKRQWPEIPWKGIGGRLPFVLENGASQLTPFFSQVDLDLYHDTLAVTEAEPLINYAFSGRLRSVAIPQAREIFTNLIREEIARQGTLNITNASGIFIAHR